MTKQEVFDRVFTHFVTTRAWSMGKVTKNGKTGVSCMYRGANGAKCAVGLFIPDELYSREIEGESVSKFEVLACIDMEVVMGLGHDHVSFLTQLQSAHDQAANVTNYPAITMFADRMGWIAAFHDLEIPDLCQYMLPVAPNAFQASQSVIAEQAPVDLLVG